MNGRRGTIHLPELHARFLAHQQWNREHGTNFDFAPMDCAQRHTWHGKKCTVLAKHGGVVMIDGVQSLYELVPMKDVILDEEVPHGQ